MKTASKGWQRQEVSMWMSSLGWVAEVKSPTLWAAEVKSSRLWAAENLLFCLV